VTGSTSQAVRAAVQQAMAEHKCDHYTRRPGIAPLCKAVAEMMASQGIDLNMDNGVVISGGTQEARYVALTALAPGRNVMVAQPGPAYAQDVLALSGLAGESLDLSGDLPAVEQGLLLLDPTRLDADTLAQVAEWAAAQDVTVIADESAAAHFGPDARPPFASLPGMAERTLTLGGFAGLDGLDAWQVAWFAGPKPLAVTVRDLKQAMTICSPAPAQYAALAAVQSVKASQS
jgi:aspartate/methionine/tyrosine aminotransferase